MAVGCVEEVDLFLAFRRELAAERSVSILRHVAGCPLCHDQWQRFELDEQIAESIQCAIQGDAEGADRGPGWGPDDELPEELEIPGFRMRPGYIDGGQARVYRGTYEASQEEVALKVFHNSLLNEGGRERFGREIKSLARLRHPNVITIRSDGEINGHPYFVMPWIEGLTLDEYVQQTPLAIPEKVDLVSKICDAVNHAHQRGVMHLDLKPTNVRVDAGGEPIVMDFGLARLTETDYSEPPGMSVGVAGTPLYMAPEQIKNPGDLDVRADVYGLGLLLYEVLVGRRAQDMPFSGGRPASLEVTQVTPLPPRTLDSRIPSELEAITLRAIEVDRDRRYATARALYDDLQNFRQGRLVQAKAHQPGYRLRKWIHLNREKIASLGLILPILGLVVAVHIYLQITYDQQRIAGDEQSRVASAEHNQRMLAQLTRSRRELAEAFDQTAALAAKLGDARLAEESQGKAERIRVWLGEGSSRAKGGPSASRAPPLSPDEVYWWLPQGATPYDGRPFRAPPDENGEIPPAAPADSAPRP